MILGIDVGYSHTKTIGENICFSFKSTVEEGALDIGNALVVEYDGKTYTIGEENGLYATEINKIHSLKFSNKYFHSFSCWIMKIKLIMLHWRQNYVIVMT